VIDRWHGLVRCKLAFFNIEEIRAGTVKSQFDHVVTAGMLRLEDLSHRRVIFDSLFEGHGPEEFRAVTQSLAQEAWFDPARAIFLNNVFDDPPSHIKSVSWPWQMIDHAGWFSHVLGLGIDWKHITRDRAFVCLMRRRSTQRANLFRELRQRHGTDTYTVSYASMIDYTGYDPIAQTTIPVLLDGPVPGEQQHRAQNHDIFRCMINLVSETSNQEPCTEISWRTRFITEKTFKCFAWHQIPIWWSVPGLVADVRSLGFDVFDDLLLEHAYDTIQDPGLRLADMLDTLDHAIDGIHTAGIDRFYQQIFPRLERNNARLLEFKNARMSHWPEIIQRVKTI
jgi:hypothetical protein